MFRRLIAGALAIAIHLPVAAPLLAQGKVEPVKRLPDIQKILNNIGENQEEEESNPPKNLKIRLTLNSPSDLKIYEGSYVAPGDLLAERTQDRLRLERQKEQLQQAYERIKNLPIGKPEPKELPELPPIGYAEREAAIASAKKAVFVAGYRFAVQEKKLSEIGQLPRDSLPASVQQHELAILGEFAGELEQAQAALALEESKLETAKNLRLYQEYQHQRAMLVNQKTYDEQLSRIASQEQQREYQLAQLEVELRNVENDLAVVGKVFSPYWGQVKRIKFQDQTNSQITVVVTFAVDASASRFDLSTDELDEFLSDSASGDSDGANAVLEQARERRRKQLEQRKQQENEQLSRERESAVPE